MKDLEQSIESLADVVAKLAFISHSCPCQDAGLKLLLEDLNHELLQIHHFWDYHTDEGNIKFFPGGAP